MDAKLEVLMNENELFLLKIGESCHIVTHDKDSERVSAVYRGDKIKSSLQSKIGLTAENVLAITKGRSFKTAKSYFGEIRRQLYGKKDL